MKFTFKSILAALAIVVSMTACNFGDNNGSSTSTVVYTSKDLLMRLDSRGEVTTPEPPQIQVFFKSTNEGSTMSFTITNLRLKYEAEPLTFKTPEIKVKFTETGMEANQPIMPITGTTGSVDNFRFQVTGNWMNMSMDVNGESVRLCSSWMWSGQQLYAANYNFNDVKSNVSLFGGTTYMTNPVTTTNEENKKMEYGVVFTQNEAKEKVANVYSFFTTFDGIEANAKTYLFENIPYTLEANGISIATNDEVAAKLVTRYDTKEDPDNMKISSLSIFIPYNGLKSSLRYVATDDNIVVSCSPMDIVQQLTIH